MRVSRLVRGWIQHHSVSGSRLDAEAAERDRALAVRIEAKGIVDVDLVERDRDERAATEVCRGQEQRLRQMSRVEEHRPVCLAVLSILPERAREPRGHDEDDLGRGEKSL